MTERNENQLYSTVDKYNVQGKWKPARYSLVSIEKATFV